MKKTLILLNLICIALFSFSNGEAQLMSNSPETEFDITKATATAGRVDESKINSRALKNFHSSYRHASEASWTILKDNSQLCTFQVSSVKYRAFYNSNGSWSYTVSSYEGEKLDKMLQEWIDGKYQNPTIVFVDQVDMNDKRRIYLVEIQSDKWIKKIRIEGEDIDTISEFTR